MENVNLNGYTGNITISLYKIVPDSDITDIIKKQLDKVSNETAVVVFSKVSNRSSKIVNKKELVGLALKSDMRIPSCCTGCEPSCGSRFN